MEEKDGTIAPPEEIEKPLTVPGISFGRLNIESNLQNIKQKHIFKLLLYWDLE